MHGALTCACPGRPARVGGHGMRAISGFLSTQSRVLSHRALRGSPRRRLLRHCWRADLGGLGRLDAKAPPPAPGSTGSGRSMGTGTSGRTGRGLVPGSGDRACINAAGDSVVFSSGSGTVLGVSDAGLLTLSGGTLQLSDTANPSTANNQTISGGSLGEVPPKSTSQARSPGPAAACRARAPPPCSRAPP